MNTACCGCNSNGSECRDKAEVLLIEGDQIAGGGVSGVVASLGLPTRRFPNVRQLIEQQQQDALRPSCVVISFCELGCDTRDSCPTRAAGGQSPVFILAGQQLAATLKAVEEGTLRCMSYPPDGAALGESIRRAVDRDAELVAGTKQRKEIEEQLATLSRGERQVLDLMLQGMANKTMAAQLSLGMRTIEKRRHDVFRKLDAGSVAELVLKITQLKQTPQKVESCSTRHEFVDTSALTA